MGRPSRRGAAATGGEANPNLQPVPATPLQSVRKTLRENGDPNGGEPVAAGRLSFLQARRANEVLKAQERRLRLQQVKDELIDRARALRKGPLSGSGDEPSGSCVAAA